MTHPDEPIGPETGRLRDSTGREESFRSLFDRCYWPLSRFFQRRGFSTDECQDLIQETFLRVYRGWAAFRGESRWEHWLFRIAANTAGKAVRHRLAPKRAGQSVPLDGGDEGAAAEWELAEGARGRAGPLRELLGKEAKELLVRAIEGLPPQMRRCVRLRVLQDLDYPEIAEILELSPSTVKVQLFKARKRLQAELGDAFVDFDA